MKTSFKRITALALTAGMAARLCAGGGRPTTPRAGAGGGRAPLPGRDCTRPGRVWACC